MAAKQKNRGSMNNKTMTVKLTYKSEELFCVTEINFYFTSGSVVECLTRGRRAVGSSLTGVTALCP